MGRCATALLCLIAALAVPVAARAANFGVADDGGKYALDGGVSFFAELHDLGLRENRITILWDERRPRTISERPFLDRSLPRAAERGIRVLFHVRPERAGAITGSPSGPARFAAFLALLARTYPQVTDVIVGNEPNQPRFWQPQFNPDGTGAAAAAYTSLLARSYDALKAVNPRITVIGGALSSRGNDRPHARSNPSTSPVRFLRGMGVALRASARRLPLMDRLAFHPYPSSNRDSVAAGHRWPNAGAANLGRIKQAVWDAFAGTGQSTFEEGLRFVLDEVGWQVAIPPEASAAYRGTESVETIDEEGQARAYADLIRLASCDRAVASLHLFTLVDEGDLERFQAGLVRADGIRRPSYFAVRSALRAVRCRSAAVRWRHAGGVIGARAIFGPLGRSKPARQRFWGFHVTAAEAVRYTAEILPVRPRRAPAALRRKGAAALLAVSGLARAHWRPLVRFPARTLPPGRYRYAIRIRAEMNPARATAVLSKPFTVG